MNIKSHLFRAALATTLFAAASANAQPRRVVIKDFDGPRALADSGHDAVVRILASEYDIVATKRWDEIKGGVRSGGPDAWRKASRKAGVDVVVDGWVQDEGRTKLLTILVVDASNGHQLDQLTVRLPAGGISEDTLRSLKKGLAERLEWIESVSGTTAEVETLPEHEGPPVRVADRVPITKTPGRTSEPAEPIGPQPPTVAVVEPSNKGTVSVFEPKPGSDWPLPPLSPAKRSFWTPKFQFGGGPGYFSRSLNVGAEFPENVTQYASVPHKALAVDAAFYPFPRVKQNAVANGVGFSFGIGHSVGSVVTFDDMEEVGDYSINQYWWNAGVHYRQVLGQFAIDGELGYGQNAYKIVDAPETFEVPDTAYQFLSAGAHLDLSITDRASVGFGGKYLHVLDQGDLTSVEWYGPGRTNGFSFDGTFVIPLPANLAVRGDLTYTRFKTTFDGVGQITEDEGVFEAVDSTIGGTVKLVVGF